MAHLIPVESTGTNRSVLTWHSFSTGEGVPVGTPGTKGGLPTGAKAHFSGSDDRFHSFVY